MVTSLYQTSQDKHIFSPMQNLNLDVYRLYRYIYMQICVCAYTCIGHRIRKATMVEWRSHKGEDKRE